MRLFLWGAPLLSLTGSVKRVDEASHRGNRGTG